MKIQIKQSAFRHNITEADIVHAFHTPCYDGPIEEESEKPKYLRIGYSWAGNLIELMYNEYGKRVCVFHAMRCRKIFYHLL
jgi:YD repeat-containing protein